MLDRLTNVLDSRQEGDRLLSYLQTLRNPFNDADGELCNLRRAQLPLLALSIVVRLCLHHHLLENQQIAAVITLIYTDWTVVTDAGNNRDPALSGGGNCS